MGWDSQPPRNATSLSVLVKELSLSYRNMEAILFTNMKQLFQVAHPPDGRRDPSVHRTWGEGAWLLNGVLFGVGIGNTIQVECLCMIIPEYYAIMPQSQILFMNIPTLDGRTLPGHYIAMLACSRALSGIFMWHARFDITCVPLVGGFNQAGRIRLMCFFQQFVFRRGQEVVFGPQA